MFHCSNQNCRALYSDPAAFEMNGHCQKCGGHLANEQNLAFNYIAQQRKEEGLPAPKAATEVKDTPKQQPTPQPTAAVSPKQTVVPAKAATPSPAANVQANTPAKTNAVPATSPTPTKGT